MDPSAMRLFHDEADCLVCTTGRGAQPVAVRPVWLAPLSHPGRFLAILDENDREIVVMEDPSKLTEESLQAVRRELRRSYLKRRITAILRARRQDDTIHWTVRTDAGPQDFETEDHPENIRWCSGGLLLIDTEGNRFEVEDLGSLDARSIALLKWVV